MKKLSLFTLLWISTFFLSSCGSLPEYSFPETQTLYQSQLETFQTLQSFFTLPASQPRQTQTSLTLTSQNNFNGELSYLATQESQENNEKATHTFMLAMENLSGTDTLAITGSVDTLYLDQMMYFNINHLNLFMGEGSAEANFINLLAKDLSGKRIALDKEEQFWLSIVETPDFQEFITDLAQLYTVDETIPSTSSLSPASEFHLPIIALSDAHLTSMWHINNFLAQLLGVPVQVTWLTLNPLLESSLSYTTLKKNTIKMTKELHYYTDTHTFSVQLSFSPKELLFILKDPLDLADPENTIPQQYTIRLVPKNATTFTLIATKEQNYEKEWTLTTTIQIKKSDPHTQIDFQGDISLAASTFNLKESLTLNIHGKQTIQPTTQPDFTLSGTILSLSDIL